MMTQTQTLTQYAIYAIAKHAFHYRFHPRSRIEVFDTFEEADQKRLDLSSPFDEDTAYAVVRLENDKVCECLYPWISETKFVPVSCVTKS